MSEEGELSYADLNARANQVAHALRAQGVGPEVRVGLYLERSMDFLAGLLGHLQGGRSLCAPGSGLSFALFAAHPRGCAAAGGGDEGSARPAFVGT